MLCILVILNFYFVIWYLFLRWKRVKSYWAERNVPHIRPHPIMGNLTFLQRVNPGIWMRDLNNRFTAPYIGIWWFWRPALVVNNPEIARKILVKNSSNFRNRFLSSGARDPIGSLNLFTVNDPKWTSLRRQMTKAFSSSKLKYLYNNVIIKKSKELLQRIKTNNAGMNIRMDYTDYTSDVISIFTFGIENDATLSGDGPLKYISKQFVTYGLYRRFAWCFIFFCPELVDVLGLTFFPKSAINYLKRIFNMIAQQSSDNNTESKSLIDAMIKLKENNIGNSIVYTDDLIMAQLAIVYLGGFDTSTNTLTFITYELAHQPEIQEKLYKELLKIKQINDESFTYEQLSGLTYLHCIIKETLRKHPSMGWIDRIAHNDYQVDDKLVIEAGTPVYINAIGMHYNPTYFPDPYKFDPDRFLPENEKDIKQYTYMPFGEGPRSCIGQKFAMLTIGSAIAVLFLNYKVSPLPNQPHISDIEIDKRGLFYSPGEILKLKFESRN